MTERKVKYQGLSLPVVFVSEIKTHIEKHPKYTSITDFVKQAIRHQIKIDHYDPNGFLDTTKKSPYYDSMTTPNSKIMEKLADNQKMIIEMLKDKNQKKKTENNGVRI